MIAYFILVHRYPKQFRQLFKAVYVPGNQYVIHVDKSSGPELAKDIAVFLEPYQGVHILSPQNASWGGYSLVEAELRGMEKLLEMDSRWTHYINLSGQDFPLKSQAYIRRFLANNPDRQFIKVSDQARQRPDTMNRVDRYYIESDGEIINTDIPRAMFADVTAHIGTQWKVVTRSFCDFVCHDPSVDRFKDFYRNSFIADESFFQTVIMNSGDQGEIIDNDLRMIDWVADGDIKLRPRNFGSADISRLKASPDLFARKFDATEDPFILGLLQEYLKAEVTPAKPAPIEALAGRRILKLPMAAA